MMVQTYNHFGGRQICDHVYYFLIPSPCVPVCLGPVTQCDTAALTGSLVTGNVMTQPVTITSRYNTFKK